jgi:hypothetical protein
MCSRSSWPKCRLEVKVNPTPVAASGFSSAGRASDRKVCLPCVDPGGGRRESHHTHRNEGLWLCIEATMVNLVSQLLVSCEQKADKTLQAENHLFELSDGRNQFRLALLTEVLRVRDPVQLDLPRYLGLNRRR